MSAIRDELIETAHWLQEKRRLREERMKIRVRCPYCKERVGQCKAKKNQNEIPAT